jgi:hypothetical protein
MQKQSYCGKASTQDLPKDYGIKTQLQHTEAILFIPFPFGSIHLAAKAGR